MSDKIINTFQMRRQLAQAFDALAATESEAELIQAARQIAHTYPSELVLNTLLKELETSSSQLRGGLGHVAALLPSDAITTALHQAAADRHNSPTGRITAAMILERFLGQSLPSGLITDLGDADDVAYQSLREALDAGKRNRHILLEYVTQMRQTEIEIAFGVMELLERVPPADRVELLRLIAQDDREVVAQEALQRLTRLSAAGEVARVLHTLQFTLPPALADQARRSLRKLRFGGTSYAPPSPAGWRALIGPADVGGSQAVWLVRMPDPAQTSGILLGFVVNGRIGMLQMFGSVDMDRAHLPGAHHVGELLAVDGGDGQRAVLLEAPFQYGRWLVARALAPHWDGRTTSPLPNEYRLYSDLIWQFDAPVLSGLLQSFFDQETAVQGQEMEPEMLESMADELLEHPAMTEWATKEWALFSGLEIDTQALSEQPVAEVVKVVLQTLARVPESRQLVESLEEGLRAQAAWLHIAGDQTSARAAHTLARQMKTMPLERNPLLTAMIVKGLAT